MFELHHDGPCLLCKGAEDDDQFDYCRSCGFTLFPFRNIDLRKLVKEWEFRWKNSDQDHTWDCIQEAKKLIGDKDAVDTSE